MEEKCEALRMTWSAHSHRHWALKPGLVVPLLERSCSLMVTTEVALNSIKSHGGKGPSPWPLSRPSWVGRLEQVQNFSHTTLGCKPPFSTRRASIRQWQQKLSSLGLLLLYCFKDYFLFMTQVASFSRINLKFKKVSYFEKQIMFTLDVDMTKKCEVVHE